MNDDIDRELPMDVADALRDREETLAVAESCTGGLIGAAITAVPGASDYFDSGLTTYAYDAKRRHLGVSREALDEHGAVSEPVARQMAQGVRDVTDTTWGIATTGVAGPTGGTEENPVGTVYIGVAYAGPWGSETSFATVSRYVFDGDRADVRARTVDQALEDLLEAIDELQ
ncbi:CinA family protein [Natronolimnohabitans innermongolicus]|uniref:Damage inducible protein CinA n=1 Tax=Natronolimnohabitans innermongolicus JCM 12255 TaxID=1227499 RepID=L9WP70_9EURY|nr:CinA family protein [Natronolimnohabitans innermongolicus]ELY51182.1 damage inducible protein CinA [Natronolimnohabitans innermongolicus JCM 12255]